MKNTFTIRLSKMFGHKKKEIDPETYIRNKQSEMTKLVKATFESAGWDYSYKAESNVSSTPQVKS